MFERYGIVPGDRILRVNGQDFEPEAPGEVFAEWERTHRSGDEVSITVQRSSRLQTLTITCGEGQRYATPVLRAVEAATNGEWQACIDNVNAAIAIAGRLSWLTGYALRCLNAQGQSTGWKSNELRWAWARMAYLYGTELVKEAGHLGSLNEVRGEVLTVLQSLEAAGFTRFASDLEQILDSAQRRAESTILEEPAEVHLGTCFAIDPVGRVLTAHHVIESATHVRVKFAQGEWRPTQVLLSSASNDLAILKGEAETPSYLPLAEPRSARVGQRVFTIGFPALQVLGAEPKFTEGSISALSGPSGEAGFLQVSVPVQPGNSGGPLVTERGEVVGVITSTAAILPFLEATGALPQNVNWAVSADLVRALTPTATAPQARSREEAIERTRNAVCMVEASR
jgi:S1-C subfamily serine protease